MIKIAFFDFDQTLYSHYSNSIPKSAIEAVNQLRNNGVKIFICSGRSLCEMDNFDLSAITIDGMIANNGQVAYDADNNILFDHPMDGLLKEKIVKKFKEKKVPLFVNTDVDVFANFINDAVIQTQKDINSPCPEVREYNGEKIYMSSAFYNSESEWDDLESIKALANITYWHDGAVDIVPNTASKANGIREILQLYGINQDETIGFGDSENDIDMMEFCKIGIAVGNAQDDVKYAADYVTSHIEEDGIYNACKYFKLI